jgi:S-adenosyl-L-methionine hydrolase (adenosine-forming)
MNAGIPIFLYTDFGSADLYAGQVKSVLHSDAPASRVIDLLNDAPNFAIAPAAHLLAALVPRLLIPSVIIAVVDPGVGSSRAHVALEADGRWFVGPDNGLLSVVAARALSARCFGLDSMPEPGSVSFHGRDLFAPAAARIASGALDFAQQLAKPRLDIELGSADLPRIIYIDHYGNAMTGIRAGSVDCSACLRVSRHTLRHARVFSAVRPGEAFWYENSIGLVEIAANRASAASLLGLCMDDEIAVA